MGRYSGWLLMRYLQKDFMCDSLWFRVVAVLFLISESQERKPLTFS